MANSYGYTTLFADRPGIWFVEGQVSIDGYGQPVFTTVPSGVVRSIVKNGGTGNYSIVLQDAWYALPGCSIQTIVPSSASPNFLIVQIQSVTVGDSSVLPVQAGGVGQQVTFQVFDDAGSEADLEEGSGFFFNLRLKKSSA